MFVMGMSPWDREASDSEKPANEVTITKAFYLTNSLGYLKLFGDEITMRHPVSCATFHAVTKIQSIQDRTSRLLVLTPNRVQQKATLLVCAKSTL
jgi:ribosomal protein S26